MNIAVVGAGPAGLVAALAGARLGARVIVFEQAPADAQRGAGFLIHSNGLRVLSALGLLESFAPYMRATRVMRTERADGSLLASFDYGALALPLAHGAVIRRHDLLEHLMGAAREARIPIAHGRRCIGARLEPERVRLELDGSAPEAFDAVVAADGIRSPLRDALGLTGRFRQAGELTIAGLSAVPQRDDATRELWLPDGRYFGICPLPGAMSFFYCPGPEDGDAAVGAPAWIESWRGSAPEAARVLDGVGDWSRVVRTRFADVELPAWHRGRAFLAGDAAHAMTPNLGQGANSSMVDGLVLMRLLVPALRDGGDLEAVGRTYHAVRQPFTCRLQRAARWLAAARSWSFGPARTLRDAAIGLGSRVAPVRHAVMELLAGHNPAERHYLEPFDSAR